MFKKVAPPNLNKIVGGFARASDRRNRGGGRVRQLPTYRHLPDAISCACTMHTRAIKPIHKALPRSGERMAIDEFDQRR